MKEGFIVRYADDFRIIARDHNTATKWFHAVKKYLKERLKLDISVEKSKVVNLRKKSSTFLGYKIKATRKKTKWYAKTNVSDKKMEEMQSKLKERIIAIKNKPSPENVRLYNSTILGMQQYFKYATHVRLDFHRLEYKLRTKMHLALKKRAKFEVPKIEDLKNSTYIRLYGTNNKKTYVFNSGAYLYPISRVKTKSNLNFSQKKNPYTLHNGFSWDIEIIKLMKSRIPNRSTEYMDNRLSRYSMQKGLCTVTKLPLIANLVHCHHILPKSLGGNDKFDNLTIVHKDIHILIHATNSKTINKYVEMYSLNNNQVKVINALRAKCKLGSIKIV